MFRPVTKPGVKKLTNLCCDTAIKGKLFNGLLVGLAILCSGPSLGAEQFGTEQDANAMLERAVQALKVDTAAALKAFNDQKNKQFHDRDLYVFCFSLPEGNLTAYEGPSLLGTNVRELKLSASDAVGQRAYDAVANAPEEIRVTMDYNFPKPGTKSPALKRSLEVRVGNQACGVTYYK